MKQSHVAVATLALVIGLVVGCGKKQPVAPEQTAPPATADLLQKVADATGSIGPATIVSSTHMVRPNRDPVAYTDSIRWNDATHYAIAETMDGQTSQILSDGKTETIYDPAKKEYQIGDAGDSVPDALGSLPELFRSGLKNPKRAPALAAARVATIRLTEGTAYAITWPHPMPGMATPSETAAITLTVRASDFLPRQLVYTDAKGLNATTTIAYKKENTPFADTTFTFTPPPGSRRGGRDFKAAAAALIGKPAPDLTLPLLSGGKPVRLSSLRGKTVLLDFWATWCPGCRAELPFVNEACAAFKDKGLVVLAVNDKEPAATLLPFVQRNALSVPVLVDTQGAGRKAYRVLGIPTLVLIGPDGVVQDYEVGFSTEARFWSILAHRGFKQ